MEKWTEYLKEQYKKIEVPSEAKKRVEDGIRKAKKERREKRIVSFGRLAGGSAAAAVAVIAVLSNSSPAIAQAMEQIPVIGAVSRIVTLRTYQDQHGSMEAEVEIPVIGEEEGPVPANQDIERYAESLIQEYEETVREMEGEGNYSLTSKYEIVFENSSYLCVRIDTTAVQASAAQYSKIFTVRKLDGETVSLLEYLGNDESKLEAAGNSIMEQMRAQMAEDAGIIYYLDSDMPEQDFSGLTGDESYYFNQKGEIVIVFDEYQVAPGYMGAVSFTIPPESVGYQPEPVS